jgi:hypothetical protein
MEKSSQKSACVTYNADDDQVDYLTDEDLRFVFSGLVRGIRKQGK